MNRKTVRSWCALCALTWSCGTPPPLREASTTPPEPTASASAPPAVTWSPVATPAGIVGKLRFRNVSQTLDVAMALTGTPTSSSDQTALRATFAEVFSGKSGLRLKVDGAALAAEVSTNVPIDLLVAIGDGKTPTAAMAISFPVRSIEATKALFGENVSESGPGVYAIARDGARVSCEIVASPAPIEGHLVCATSEGDLEKLGLYMARNLSAEPPPTSDVTAEIDVRAIDDRFGADLRAISALLPRKVVSDYGRGNPGYDQALRDLATFGIGELTALVGDVEHIALSANVSATEGLAATLETRFRGERKSTLGTYLASPAAGPATLFWRGPAEATGANFIDFPTGAKWAGASDAMRRLIAGWLAVEKVGTEAERKKLVAALELPFSGEFVSFGGADRVTPRRPARTPEERWQAAFDGLAGWYLFGSHDNLDKVGGFFERIVAAMNQPGIKAAIAKATQGDTTLALKKSSAPKALGPGALAFELSFKEKASKSAGTVSLLVSGTPDGTWFALGFDPVELTERIVRAQAATGAIGARKDLADLNVPKVQSGSFMTLRSFRSTFFSVALWVDRAGKAPPEEMMGRAVDKTDAMIDGLPHKGLLPLTVTSSLDGNTHRLSVKMNPGLIDDIAASARLIRGGAR